MSSRIDFPVPPGSLEGTCRHCLAPIVWVQGKSGMMPLDVRSTVRTERASGAAENRAESHFAHCPKATLVRKTAPRALCYVSGCGNSIPRARTFCPKCWSFVPVSVRRTLKANAKDYGPRDERTLRMLRRAGNFALERRNAASRTQGEMFSRSPTPHDPG